MFKFLLSMSRLLDVASTATKTAAKIAEILDGIVAPCLTVIGSIGVIYMIVIGVQYAKAESDEKRSNYKKRLINLTIGVLVMLVLITLCYAIKWDSVIPEIFGYFKGAKEVPEIYGPPTPTNPT